MTFPHLATCSSGLLTSLASGEWERATYGDRKWLAADSGRGASHVECRTGFTAEKTLQAIQPTVYVG